MGLYSLLRNPINRRYIELLFELVEANLKYNLRIIKESGSLAPSSDLFIFEHQISEIPKEVIDTLISEGVLRRNPILPEIIEVVNINKLFDAYNRLIMPKEPSKESPNRKDIKEEHIEDMLEYLAQYVEPRIKDVQGLDKVKKIMLLQLFSERDRAIRNRIHILLLGEPGTGKSLLLQWQAKVSDGIYRSLRVTYAGLSGSVRSYEFNRQTPLLKKADGKILCLDEIDKIEKQDLDPLLSAMEEGIVTLSGATMDTIYEARVRVLAAANRDKFRPEFKDRFDYIKRLRKLRFSEISDIMTHLIDFMSDSDITKMYFDGINIIRNRLKEVENFHPKIKESKKVSRAIVDVLSEDETADSVRHSQKWLRFALAYAKMKKTDVTPDLIYELYEKIKEL